MSKQLDKYLQKMTDIQVIEKRIVGDNKAVAGILGITEFNVAKVLKRPTAKRYPEVMKVLRAIVENRESLKKDAQQFDEDE